MADQMQLELYRSFLKDSIRLKVDFSETDQRKGIAPPPIEKSFSEASERIKLPGPKDWMNISKISLTQAIKQRASHRHFRSQSLSREDVAFLLWATQGTRQEKVSGSVLRTVPSAGCRHAFETYLFVFNVSDVKPGVYRYLPLEHELLFEFSESNLEKKLSDAALGQSFIGRSAVTFVWTVIPYRMEWRYGLASYKVLAMDAGHMGQNLYLACSAIDAGTCTIAAYHQSQIDALLRVDGEEEFVIYLAPVGKI